MVAMNGYVGKVLDRLQQQRGWEQEFIQSVTEVYGSLSKLLDREPKYEKYRILERLMIPERTIIFQIPWVDDKGEIQVNVGCRVQFNSAIGPYKGGLRFHPSVNPSILKFLGFEQIFKNALTTLPMGGGKGGSDFDPKGKSENEIMRFCQNMMRELYRHIGPDTDVPAGDIGVGAREIGYLFGQYKKITNATNGAITGRGLNWGGSRIRPEATGYGNVYFAGEMLATRKMAFEGLRVMVSGSGNVAQYGAAKAMALGAKVISLSDSNGTIIDEEGLTSEKLDWIMDLKNNRRGRIEEYARYNRKAVYHEGKRPWQLARADIALPSATQNELNAEDARALVAGGCVCISEGANMPSTPEAVEVFRGGRVLFGPGKAANAGGVATSGLEMSQSAIRMSWTAEEVDMKLRGIMRNIHEVSRRTASEFSREDDYVAGANIAAFRKVADAMIDLGV